MWIKSVPFFKLTYKFTNKQVFGQSGEVKTRLFWGRHLRADPDSSWEGSCLDCNWRRRRSAKWHTKYWRDKWIKLLLVFFYLMPISPFINFLPPYTCSWLTFATMTCSHKLSFVSFAPEKYCTYELRGHEWPSKVIIRSGNVTDPRDSDLWRSGVDSGKRWCNIRKDWPELTEKTLLFMS